MRWEWRRVLLAALVVTLPTAIAALIPPVGATRLQATDAVAWLVFHVLIAGAGAMLYSRWRLSGESDTAWLSVALVAVGLSGTPFAILNMADVANRAGRTGDVTGALLAVPLVVIVVCASSDRRFPDRVPPLALGVATGVVLVAGRLLYSWVLGHPLATLPQPWGPVLAASLAVAFLVACVIVRRQRTPAGLTTPEFAAMVAALVTIFVLGPAGTTGDSLRSWPSVAVMMLVAGWMGLSAAQALLHPMAQQARRLDRASRATARRAPPVSHQQEELFHELRSTVADISTAAQILLGDDHRLSDSSRRRLSSGLATEVARLQRLVSPQDESRIHCVSLDQVIAPLVVTQRAAGHDIRWEPSGQRVRSCQDDVTEIVHVLLHNALRHAPGTTITVSVHQRAHNVEIRVSDAGPGIPADVRDSLFQRGARSTESPGSGLGLYLARRLATKHGGSLQLRHNDGRHGASFVAALPHFDGEES